MSPKSIKDQGVFFPPQVPKVAELNISPPAKDAVRKLSSYGLINVKNATSSNGYIHPRSLTSNDNKQQEQCVALVKALTNVAPKTENWSATNTKISPYLIGNHPDIAPGSPIATFKSDRTYPGKTGDMGTPRLDGKAGHTQSHAAIFVDYIWDGQRKKIGMKILSQSEAVPAAVEDKYFIAKTSRDQNLDTVGYEYSVIQH